MAITMINRRNLGERLVSISVKGGNSSDSFQDGSGPLPEGSKGLTVTAPWRKKLNQDNPVGIQNLGGAQLRRRQVSIRRKRKKEGIARGRGIPN